MSRLQRLRQRWRDTNLFWYLFLAFLLSLAFQAGFCLWEVMLDCETHGQPFTQTEFWVKFSSRTFENWQSEFLQLAAFVIFSAYFVFRGSPQSKTAQEETDRQLMKISEQLGQVLLTLEGDQRPSTPDGTDRSHS